MLIVSVTQDGFANFGKTARGGGLGEYEAALYMLSRPLEIRSSSNNPHSAVGV